MSIRELLNRGVARGVITPEQAEALLALDATEARAPEAPRGFNGIAVAYAIGAIVVLSAFGWFMVDRWQVLGPGGLFGLSVAYAVIFLGVAHVLKREGFQFARGVAMLLAVSMAPIAMWAVLLWTGAWTPEHDRICRAVEHPFGYCQGQPMAVELAAVAAALVAMRQLAFSPFMIPIAVVAITLPERLLREAVFVGPPDGAAGGWRWVMIASVLAAASYTMDRRRRGEDYAFWLWLSAAFAAFVGVTMLFVSDSDVRWALGPVALLMLMASVMLRRRVLLVLGLAGVFGFLAWLAFDVFKLTTAFPLVLALIGIVILILTVWAQKRFPEVIRRVGGDPSQPPRFPGGVFTMLAPIVVGVLLAQDASAIDRDRRATMRTRGRVYEARQRHRQDSIAARRGGRAPQRNQGAAGSVP